MSYYLRNCFPSAPKLLENFRSPPKATFSVVSEKMYKKKFIIEMFIE